MTPRFSYRVLPYIACLAACIAVDLFYFPRTTIFPDEQRFLASAMRLAASGAFWVGSDRAWEMPGTALFIAPAVWLFGAHGAITAVRLAQAALVVVQCALIAATARRIFANPLAGFIAACIAALYPYFLFYQGLLLSETLFDTLLMAAVAALFWWRDRGFKLDRALALACLCFAAATMTKATLTILPPLLLAATAWIAGVGLRRAFVVLLAASCLYAAFMSPWWVRNAALLHSFVPFTTSSAMNLYLGNNPHNSNAGIDWGSDVDPAVVARINALPDELARQRAYSAAAMAYIKEHPATFLRNAVRKLGRFWNVVPNAAEFRSGLYAFVSALSFGPILVLALVCALLRWRQWRMLAPIYLIIGYFTFVHAVTIASLRYRLPVESLLIVLAAGPLAALIESMRESTAGRVKVIAGVPRS